MLRLRTCGSPTCRAPRTLIPVPGAPHLYQCVVCDGRYGETIIPRHLTRDDVQQVVDILAQRIAEDEEIMEKHIVRADAGSGEPEPRARKNIAKLMARHRRSHAIHTQRVRRMDAHERALDAISAEHEAREEAAATIHRVMSTSWDDQQRGEHL